MKDWNSQSVSAAVFFTDCISAVCFVQASTDRDWESFYGADFGQTAG